MQRQVSEGTLASCPLQGLSIACSTPEALAWDPDWADTHEISGRAMHAVHDAGHDFTFEKRAGSGALPPAAPSGTPAVTSHVGQAPPMANGALKPQQAPLPSAAPLHKEQPRAQQQTLSKGIADAAKANGIHVTAG